jgi:hypothetical protein
MNLAVHDGLTGNTLGRYLDSWRGLGDVVVGVNAQRLGVGPSAQRST